MVKIPQKYASSGSFWFAYKKPTLWLIVQTREIFLVAKIFIYKIVSTGLCEDDFGSV